VWDINTGGLIATSRHEVVVYSVYLSQEGELLAGGAKDGTASVWNARTGDLIHTVAAHSHPGTSVALSFTGRHLATRSLDNHVTLWDVVEKRLVATFLAERGEDWVTYTPEGYFIGSDEM
jgi:WD40 repeat protein